MGVPIGFQFILDNPIEILISVIVIGVATCFFSKGNTSSSLNECSSRSIAHLTVHQQQRSKTTGRNDQSASTTNTTGKYTNCQSALPYDDNEQMVMDIQAANECALGKGSTFLSGENSMMEAATCRDTTDVYSLATEDGSDLDVSVLQQSITTSATETIVLEETFQLTKNQQSMDDTSNTENDGIQTVKHQTNIHEPPKPMSRDNNGEVKVKVTHDKDNELSTPHKKQHQHVSSFNENQTTSTKSPSPRRNKRHAKTDNPATDHSAPLHQPHTDYKPKQDLTRYEQIGQQRQPYVALYKSRCEFWPKCTNNHCKYYHPFTECRNGNACKFGNKCVFLHPRDYLDLKHETRKKKKATNKPKSKPTNAKLQGKQAKPVE